MRVARSCNNIQAARNFNSYKISLGGIRLTDLLTFLRCSVVFKALCYEPECHGFEVLIR
jgi:hypothetical protein